MGATGVWYGIAAANVLMVLVSSAYLLGGTRTNGVVEREARAGTLPSVTTEREPA